MKRMGWGRVWLFACAGLLFCSAAWGQTTGEIRGVVNDPSGAVVPNATVTATLTGTATRRMATSGGDGTFDMPELPIGSYLITAEARGFKKYVAKDVVVSIGHVNFLTFTLQIGGAAETVTVEANAVQVETTSTQLGAVMNDIAVRQLPLNTRDTYQLLQLQPGVQSQLGSSLFYGSDSPGVVSVNGGRGRSNNYMVNGGDANDAFVNLPAIQPSPDAIEEFRVITNTFDAEFGRNSGAVVDVVTKSGTNSFHGDVFEFFRNDILNARGFFDSARPDSKQNQFGGTMGGPIKKDKTFIFGSYEGRRIRKGISSDVFSDPTQAERSGDFSGGVAGAQFAGNLTSDTVATILNERCNANIPLPSTTPTGAVPYSTIFPNSQIPTNCFDPVALNLFNHFVAPNDPTGTGSIQTIPVESDRGDQGTIRFDHKITENQQLSAYYYIDDLEQSQPFSNFQAAGANVPGFGDLNKIRVQQINVSHTWTVSSTSVNEFRFAYFREGQPRLNHPQRLDLVTNSCNNALPAASAFCFTGNTDVPIPGVTNSVKLGITPHLGPAVEGVPNIQVGGGFFIGNNFEGELHQTGNSFQWSDTYSKVVGKHSLKFGGDVRRVLFDQFFPFEVNGLYIFSTGGPNSPIGPDLFPDYFLGLPTSYGQGSANGENVRASSFYLFAEDSWKIKTNLTLNYGLRWELNTPMYDTQSRIQTFHPGVADTKYPCVLQPNYADGNPNPSSQALIAAFSSNKCGPADPGASVFPLGLVLPGDAGVPRGLTQTYYKAFAPRIGLAWSPNWTDGWLSKLTGGPGKTSIRAGYGIFYNPIEQLVLEQFSAEPPFGGSTSLSNVLLQAPYVSQSGTTAPNPFSGILNPSPGQSVDWSVFRPILLFGEFQPHMRTQYSEQYNLTIQRELPGKMLFQIGYVGSEGHRLLATRDLNHGNPQTCVDLSNISVSYAKAGNSNLASKYACGPFFEDSSYSLPANSIPAGMTLHLPYGPVPSFTGPINPEINLVGLRRFSSPICQPANVDMTTHVGAGCPPDGVPVFGSIYTQDTVGKSNYNSLQVLVEKQFAHGLQFQGAYTFSKSFDDASSFEELQNPFDARKSRSLSLFDARHRFVFSYYWEIPIPKHQGVTGKLVNGWALSGIVTYQTGFPVRVGNSATTSLATTDQELLDGAGTDFTSAGEPDLTAPFHKVDPHTTLCAFEPAVAGCSGIHIGFDPTGFALPDLGKIGNSPRAICCSSPINQTDMAIVKSTGISERFRAEFRAEFFNTWNHTEFFPPNGNFPDGTDFGRVKHTRDPRQIQFGLKLLF